MVDKKKHEEKAPEAAIQSALGRTEAWIQGNSGILLTLLLAVVVVVGGYFAYQYLYKAPRQERAAEAIYPAQEAFAADSVALALNGDGNTIGFLQIIDRYGNTATGNLARHYAGQCYLKLGDYDNAIAYFGRYKNVKNSVPAQLVNAVNAGLTGDAYVQSGDLLKGAAQYEKAVRESENPATSPYYCRKAGESYEALGNYAKALEMYRIISDRYPASREAAEVDKAIALAEQKL